jgi:peptidoglycan/xylan/chitin deacetylase (PgdA/CDA1 family)
MRPALQLAARVYAHCPWPREPAVMVLAYHRIADERSNLAVSPRGFAEQMAWLAHQRSRLPVLSLEEASDALDNGSAPRRSVVITFDDAWADNHAHGLPALVEHAIPATLYVPSRLLGRRGHLSVSQFVAMAEGGVVVGAHSRTHRDLRTCSRAELDAEVRGSRQDLEDILGRRVESFAYPAGLHDDRVVDAVASAGYRSAVTTSRGWLRRTSDRLRIPRGFVEGVPLATFAAAARGGANVLAPADALKSAVSRHPAQPLLPC